MNKNILVTGGAGFVGSHVAEELLRKGYRVVILDDLSGGNPSNVPAEADLVTGSVLNRGLVAELFDGYPFDYVFHLAAYAGKGLSHFIKRFNYQNNLVGSVNLINAAINHDVKCFVFTSSIAVYGQGQLPLSEDQTPMPVDSFGIAKYSVEMELKATREMFGLNSIIFRPHNVYGERQDISDRYQNVAGIFMNKIMEGEPMTIFGDGRQTRAFSYIADVAPIIARSIETPEAYNQVFNIGADMPYSVNFLAHVVADAMGVEPNIVHLPPRNEVQHVFCSHQKARDVFGDWEPVDLEDGIARMAAWARKVGAQTSKDFDEIEVWRKLPPSWAETHQEFHP